MNDVILKAAALTLRSVPEANSIWVGGDLVKQSSVDVSVAVATKTGLITPIVFNADNLSVGAISSTIAVSLNQFILRA